uniref:Uncharacterized protein n=2 Tax=Arundo donax TaxID=35708 RepID=A0A0A9E5B8_ARUDO
MGTSSSVRHVIKFLTNIRPIILLGLPEYIGTRLCPLVIIIPIVCRSSFALMSSENVSDIGVMASFAIF